MDVLDDEFITHETVRGKARLNCEEASRYCVEYGDVLFQRSSENQEDAGTSIVYLDQHVSSAFGGFVIRGKKVGEYNPIFIKYLLGSSSIREQITHRAQGAQHINVSQDTLADVVLLMPSMREQEAVGLVFLHLDSLVTLHQRKLTKLHHIKKALLEKMFPTPGSTIPEIRFQGFTETWKQQRVGEFFLESDERSSTMEILSVSVANGIYPASESDRDTNPGASLANYKVVRKGDIVYNSMRMWQGAVGSSIYDGIVSPAYVVARPAVELDSSCFGYLLKQPEMLYRYLCDSQGNSKDTQTLRFSRFAEIKAEIPTTLDEQQAISTCLGTLDHLVTLYQHKLNKLHCIKKALLEKMFV